MTQQEFKTCFDDWFDDIRNYISYRSYDPELATDITQEAYMKLWEKGLEYRGMQTRSLLYKIANELWISTYRKKQSEKNYAETQVLDFQKNTTEESYNAEQLQDRISKSLAELPEKRRTVFLLSRMEGLTYQQIATQLDISVKAVEKRMSLTLETLRKKLKDEC
ncbi:MAG: sigma-70 family RNA polymerase sigma factor [Bacteroidota bacterium]